MGKRELVLILAFALVGFGVYRLTAPESPASGEGFSLSRLLNSVREEFRREDFKQDVTREARQDVPTAVSGLTVWDFRGQLSVRGEARPDIVATLETEVYGADQAASQTLAEQVRTRFEQDGQTLRVVIDRPASRRRPRTVLRLVVPARLALKVETIGRVDIEAVAAVQMDLRNGDVALTDIAGEVRGDHRNGELTIKGAGDVALTTRESVVRLSEHRGGLKGDLTGGRLVSRGTAGETRIDARRTEMELDEPAGTVTVTATDGELTVRQPLRSVSFDGRRCDLSYVAGPAVALDAASLDAPIEATLPQTGVTLDLAAEEGRLDLPEDLAVTKGDRSEQMSGDLAGGGARWKLRATRASIRIRKGEGPKAKG